MINGFRLKAIAGVAACLIAGSAFAQHAGKGHGHDNDGATAARGSGGQLRALTPEEARDLVGGMARFVDQSDAGLKQTQLPFGVVIDLEDRFQSVSLARIASDGSVVLRCVGTANEASHFITGPDATAHVHRRADGKRRAAPVVVLEEK
jgi:hypothetical protein